MFFSSSKRWVRLHLLLQVPREHILNIPRLGYMCRTDQRKFDPGLQQIIGDPVCKFVDASPTGFHFLPNFIGEVLLDLPFGDIVILLRCVDFPPKSKILCQGLLQ